ncbi:Type I inositol 1,4,5-trisphosphate 5-phosphatase 1 [Apostasia shenzhenica]|uniref:Type I inositol 1,4,5-trisphosphate 5-phosphatase 1 n=1 Tax=Apostasia shenzhenica TaxID=1088818 RepID=A0A2H9ZU37_9ASPA|nr:Type I inositol 1,4,5-trisphosphate 5-phosphatase 1 [Apostasia shenzhenica]
MKANVEFSISSSSRRCGVNSQPEPSPVVSLSLSLSFSVKRMKQPLSSTRKQGMHSWPRAVFRKWLNLKNEESDFSADKRDENSDIDDDELEEEENHDNNSEGAPCKLRRRKSETIRAQYINAKEIRVCVGTWNVGGKVPPGDLDIEEWLDADDPADIYVLGIQEIVPLNAGNIFGAKDSSRVQLWENLIRDSLNKFHVTKQRYKCYSNPSSPSRFNPSDDPLAAVDELLFPESDSEYEDRIHPFDEFHVDTHELNDSQASKVDKPSLKRLERCRGFSLVDSEAIPETPISMQKKLSRTLSRSERIGLAWPEQPLDLLFRRSLDSQKSFRSKSYKACSSFKSVFSEDKDSIDVRLIQDFDFEAALNKKKLPAFVRIISKQMVGIFVSIWVRRSLRKNIQNLKVSTVGVGAMGYIGNKGSISVSISIYQTQFCFICTHLSSGERNGDEIRRNSDVQEIHRRTTFIGTPKAIQDHERIIWFGDLNYRIDLSYEKTHELIAKNNWSELIEKDQLKRELKKGRAFDGWTEGIINFPPTYKYEFNSTEYIARDSQAGRRTPAWCDRILTFGKGLKLLSYRRSELKLSDHRPVTAMLLSEVEVFSHRKLQRALTLTCAEVEDGNILSDIEAAVDMGRLVLGEVQELSEWEPENA